MNANSGSLDTFLFLLDPSGNSRRARTTIALKATRDAEITNALLP